MVSVRLRSSRLGCAFGSAAKTVPLASASASAADATRIQDRSGRIRDPLAMRVRSKLVFPNRNGGYAPLGYFQAVRAVQGWGHGPGHEFHADPIRARRA